MLPVLEISGLKPFSKGGNRLCFVHPERPDRCLKVLTAESAPQKKRLEKGWIGKLRPLTAFDENLQEAAVLAGFFQRFPATATRHLPRSYGIVTTDLGSAHETDLIRDDDNRISQTLEQYLWHDGVDATVEAASLEFRNDWEKKAPSTRCLLPHNIVIQITQHCPRLILIDGFGRKSIVNTLKCSFPATNKRALEELNHRIQTVLQRRASAMEPKPRISQLNRDL